MHAKELKGISLSDEISLLSTLLKKHQQLALEEEAKVHGASVGQANWYICLDEGKGGPLSNELQLAQSWEDIRSFFNKKAQLCYFFNKPLSGVVVEKPTFYLSINPEYIRRFAFKKQIKLNEFTSQNIKKIPFPDVFNYLKSYLGLILQKKEIRLFQRVQTAEKIFYLCSYYLKKEQSQELMFDTRQVFRTEIIHICRDLDNELKKHSFMSEASLRQSKEIYHIAKKFYFFSATEKEETILSGLQQTQKEPIKTALMMIVSKLMNS